MTSSIFGIGAFSKTEYAGIPIIMLPENNSQKYAAI